MVIVEEKGVKEAFKKMEKDMYEAIKIEMAKTAEIVKNDAKRLCAVDTGRLRSSISAEQVSGNDFHYKVGSNVEYTSYVEFGTSRMGPQPFLRPAAKKGRKVLERRILKTIRNIVKKYFTPTL